MEDWLAARSRNTPHKKALFIGPNSWTFLELHKLTKSMAANLYNYGIRPKMKIAILMNNCLEFIVLINALIKLNAILVPVNTQLTPSEIKWQLDFTDIDHIIISKHTEALVRPLISSYSIISVNQSQNSMINSMHDFRVIKKIPFEPISIDMEDTQCIIFTSGTTGKPKGAMLSYKNHFYSAVLSAVQLGNNPKDKWLLCIPLYHIGGLSIIFRCCIYGIGIILHDKFDEEEILESMLRHEVTIVSLVPIMLKRLVDCDSKKLVSTKLKILLIGGDAISKSLLKISTKLRIPIVLTYGLTEAASQVATSVPFAKSINQKNTGKPMLFTRIRILDSHNNELSSNKIGEIAISGPILMKGYFGENLLDGEFKTGDLGFIDEENNLNVIQRRTDLIITGGENVYPVEIEEILNSHEKIFESCVVGIEDNTWGQKVVALVIQEENSNLTKEQLVTFCQKYLAGYKVPRIIKFTNSIPKTKSGKIMREKVKKNILDMLSEENTIK